MIEGPNYPWGDYCPCCKRPHVFEYSDGSKVCDKCDELVFVGRAIETPNMPYTAKTLEKT
jgi:ribosomal protein L37AE/L43A